MIHNSAQKNTPFVLTLISPRYLKTSEERALLGEILPYLRHSGAPTCLRQGCAYDIPFTLSSASPSDQKRIWGAMIREISIVTALNGVDFCIQPLKDRPKKLFLADMDSTIIQQECIDEMANIFNLRERISTITEKAMKGEIDFDQALKERVRLLAGLPLESLLNIRKSLQLTPGADVLIRTLRKQGVYCVLISGGFTLFTEEIARRAGFHEHYANTLEIDSGVLTGKLHPPLIGRAAKQAHLEHLQGKRHLTQAQICAVGDGANDLSMLQKAGLGVAYHAKPALSRCAHCAVRFCDLSALLYIMGYPEETWAYEDGE